jgi:hypothetical protein
MIKIRSQELQEFRSCKMEKISGRTIRRILLLPV